MPVQMTVMCVVCRTPISFLLQLEPPTEILICPACKTALRVGCTVYVQVAADPTIQKKILTDFPMPVLNEADKTSKPN